ncbi:MAG: UDP-glucose 4-epimerase GalE [Candidatus Muiribacterium halophilum]|uniref:UDP-glucose 4-epimerase n=1 Tax=Muiribacterium halophilum TaxID=2053465 RepID=A0A2N5ZHK3_MUIH1|nr:MAG: UDP-glucose 4-epimerase GalE [Candidatus Muirbacterium halophilum]
MILVCGGAGYIGSHCVEILKKEGYDVVVFDNLVYGHEEFTEDVEFFKGDLADISDIRRCFSKYNIDCVMHFSAYCYVGESVKSPEKYYYNNVVGTLNLLKVMIENDVLDFIFSSTCATYGEPEFMPMDEKHRQSPVNPYGNSKLMIEMVLKDYERAYGLRSIIFRYFNAAGASLSGRSGEWHEPETHLIPLILDVAAGKRESITIFGEDYDTKDGTCVRDYVHVLDIAKAHVLGFELLKKEKSSNHFNLGSEEGFSVLEIIRMCENITGNKIDIKKGNRREGDPPVLIADSTKAKNVLGWQKEYSDIETVLSSAWDWHKRLQEKYK